jgi:hypothetical protein
MTETSLAGENAASVLPPTPDGENASQAALSRAPSNLCAQCGEDFGSLGAFDKHQDVSYKREPVIICRDPESIGMHQDRHGRWRLDGGGYWGAASADGTGEQTQVTT